MPKKSTRRETQSKNRSKLSKQPIAASNYPESVLVRLERGTLARIDNALERFEGRSHMLREAIEREIKRREGPQRD